MKTFMWVVLGIVALLVVIGLVNKPSEADESANVKANQEHCARMNLVYVRKDPWDKGECVTASQAATQIMQMQREQQNKGLR